MDRKLCGLHSLATVVSARELHRPSGVEAERNITSQRQVPQLFFPDEYALRIIGRRLKLFVPKYRPDPVGLLEDILEKVHSKELKPWPRITC